MSYILNALRKSERERQAIEPDTVTARITVHQPQRHPSPAKLVAALIAVNLAILVYFLGFGTALVAPPPAAAVVTPGEAGRPQMAPPSPIAAKPSESKSKAIADIVEARAAVPTAPIPDKPAPTKTQPVEAVRATPIPAPVSPPPIPTKAEAVEKVIENPAPSPAQNDWPSLDELPAEFSRSLPNLPINVLSYSASPSERFVMIDMVKYVPGQLIKDQLELKEIRPDSIVVSYNGRTFKIKRP